MKTVIYKIKKYVARNKANVSIGIFSLFVFIVGIFAIGFLKSLLIIGAIDAVLFGAPIIKDKMNMRKKQTKSPIKKAKTKEKVQKRELNSSSGNTKKIKRKKNKIATIFKIFLIICCLGFLACIVLAGIFLASIVASAPNFDPNQLYAAESTILYDKDGNEFAKLGAQKRERVSYDDLPEVLINAIVATEDSRYFQHNGFDLPRFAVASVKQVLHRPGAGGASTLTMQVVKNTYTSTEDEGIEGIKRKFTDIYMAIFKVEKHYTKEEILEFYVNTYFLGSGAYGVEQASQTYFGKSVRDLNLAEASIIAGLFQSPSSYSPFIHPDRTEKRRNTVLNLMVRHGYITEEEKDAALAISVEDLVAQGKNKATTTNKYQDFIDTVVAEIRTDLSQDPYRVPMKVYTTLDPKLQSHVEDIESGKSYDWENDKVQTGISVINTKTGAIAAIGAGRNRSGEGQLNRATDDSIRRQIGSTAKPLYDYGPNIEFNNGSSYSPFYDEQYQYTNGPEIYNWDGGYSGWQTSREALAASRNVPALKAFQSVSKKSIVTFAQNLGLHPETDGNTLHEAHAIGGYNGENPLSLGAAYAAFGNEGIYTEPYSYTKIVYRDTGEELENKKVTKQAMSKETAYIVFNMLVTTSNQALGWYAQLPNCGAFGAKTGTSNFPDELKKSKGLPDDAINDLWVVGLTDEYTISVWYGYDSYKDGYTHFGSTQHERLWNAVARGVFTRGHAVQQPSSVSSVTVENFNGTPVLPSEFTPDGAKITELFVSGTEPTEVSTRYAQLANVTDLKSSYSNGTVTLSWKGIATPDGINRDKLVKDLSPIIKGSLNGYVDSRIAELGHVVYKVYAKDAAGNLSLIDQTDKNTINLTVYSTAEPITYIVKSSYSNYGANASTGATTTVDFGGSSSILKFDCKSTISINKDTTFTVREYGPTVYDNLVDVTDQASITATIDSGAYTLNNFTSTVGTYTVHYKVVYGGTTKEFTQTVVVK